MDQDSELSAAVGDDYIEVAAAVFTMLADPTRIRIVLALRDGELSVNHLSEVVGKSAPAVSQHLAKLRLAQMVAARQEGNRVFYRLTSGHVRRLVTDAIHQAEHAVDDVPRHHQGGPSGAGGGEGSPGS